MQDTIDSSRAKPEVLRRQVVPVPTPQAPELPQLGRRRSPRWLFIRCTSLTEVVVQWTTLHRRVLTSVRVSALGHVACFDPKVTA